MAIKLFLIVGIPHDFIMTNIVLFFVILCVKFTFTLEKSQFIQVATTKNASIRLSFYALNEFILFN